MQSRFLFLDAEGREVSAASMEELARHYRAGRLTAKSLFYDASTREWAPARSHPLFRTVSGTGAAASPERAPEPDSPSDEPASSTAEPAPPAQPHSVAPELPEITLAPEAEAGAAVQDFLKTREMERAEEAMRRESGEVELPLVDPALGSVAGTGMDFTRTADPHRPLRRRPGAAATAQEAPQPKSATAEPVPDVSRSKGFGGWRPFRRRRRGGAAKTQNRPAGKDRSRGKARRSPRRASRAASGSRRQAALFVTLLGVGTWGIVDAWSAPLQASPVFGEERVLPPLEPPPLTSELASAQDGAFQDMVDGMERMRRRMGVGAPPVDWMSGPYFADAADFSQVPAYWARYAQLADTLSAVEEDLFRSGFVRRMGAQGIQGSVLTIRLARAVREFRQDAQRRQGYYDAMRTVATLATELHGFLVAESARITYTPPERGLAGDPVLEISTSDPALLDAIWYRVDRLMAELEPLVGNDPLQRRDVTGQVLEALGGV